MKIWHTLVYLLFFAIGALFYGHLAQAAATSVSIQTPDSINKAYAKPNSTIPVLYYVTADPPGFSAFYGINLIKDGASYSYNQFNRTFLEGSQGYGDDFNVGTPGDGLYDLYINILGAHDTNLSSVVVDGTAPTVPTVIYPSASGIYLKPSNPVLIRWTASTDANFGATPIRVVYSLTGTFLDGVTIVNLPATATSTTWYPPAVNVNTAKVAVIATDLAGNTINDVSNYAFTIDNTAPVIKAGAYVVLSSPATPGATATDNYTSGANLTYAWSQVSGPGSISFSNNAILNPVISASVSGTYVASLTVTDQAGNQSTDTFSFLWDGNPGAFNITAPTIGQIIRGSSNTSVAWTLPPDSDLSHFDIHYSTNNGGDWTLVTSNLASTTTSYSWAVPAANSDQSVVRVTAYDVDGNNTPSVSDSFIIDSTAPSITITSPNLGIINTPTASGASATDVNGIASYAWTKFSGPGTITFATSSTIANPTMAADADGAYVARLTVTDNAGNTSTSDVSFTWDTTGPDITIANANLGAINTPTASGASATDANGVASYAWTKVSGPGTITFAPSATSTDPVMSASEDGAYVARFTVTDTVGNSSTSDVNFTWDTTAPNITITNSNLGAIRVATASGASASDTNGIASYAWTKVSGTGTITFSSSATIANPTMAANTDGAYVARLTVTDNAGNTSTSDVSFIWDTTGPDITITNASLGAINTPTASGASATDANGVASYAWTKVSGPGTITFAASAAIANPTMAANTNGVYVARLTVTDMAGNTNTSDVNFIWDTIAPTITITNSNLGAIRVATASGASASDTNGIASYSWAKFSGPGTITFASSATIANPTMSADADGAYVARLTVTDNAGNTNNANVNFTWDSTAPVITINPITPDPTGDSTPTFTGNATDALNNISGVEYQVDGGGSWIACTAADGSFNSSNENYTCTISPALIEDVHIVNVRSTDAIGNTSDGSVSDTFTVNLSGPSITPMSDRAEKVQFNQDATTVNATSWLWSFTGPGTITFGTPNAEDTTITANTDGVYTVTLTANDGFTNSAESFQLTWDSTAPVITINPITPDPTGDSTPTFTGNATDALNNISGVEYQIDGGSWAACTAVDGTFDSNNENYTCTVSPALSEASHTVNVLAIDALGNTSDDSVSDTFTVNLSGPSITPMSDRAEKVQFNQDATTVNATSWLWSFTGPGTITFGTPNAEDTTITANTDGIYTITLTANDGFTNSAESFQLTWDSTAPVITINPITPDPTGDSTPTFTGNATDALNNITGVEYQVDGGSWAACTAVDGTFDSNNENYTCTVSPALSEASHTVNVLAIDALGNTSDGSVSDTFTVNLSGPSITPMSDRSENALFTQNATTTGAISWTWTYTGPGVITFGTANEEDTTISASVDGTYTVTLTANDGFTNSAESFQLTWDSTAPVITINPITPDPTGDSTPTFTGNATDALNNISGVEYQIDGGSWAACTAADGTFNSLNEGYTCTISPELSANTYIVAVRASDVLSNTSDDSVSDTFTVNLSGPSITPMSDRAEKVQFNQDATTVNATSWLWSFTGPGTITFGTPNAEDTTITANTDGIYTITLTANDGFTNSAESFQLTWDSTAPVITINPITPDPTGDSTPTFTGNATDALNNITGVEYQVDGGSWAACTAVDGTFDSNNENYTCTVSPALSEASHTVNVIAIDALGNTSDGSVSDTFTVNLSGPSITPMSDRSENALFTQNATTTGAISWTWTYTGPGVITFGTANEEDTTISASVDGTYTVTLTAADDLNNTVSSFQLIWDTTPPVITVNTPDLGTISIASLSDTSITDDNSVANILWKKISGPGSINFTDNELIANPLLSATLTGSYTVMVEAWDEAGNTASSTVEFIWSGDPATPYITNPAGGSYVAGDTAVNITWVSSGEDDLDYFKLWYSGDSGDTWNLLADDIASTTSTYSWQSPEVDSGGHLFKLAVYNLATNSTTTVSLPFFIDSTHPTSVLVTHPDALTLPVKGGSDLEITWTGGEDDHLGVTPITLEYSVSGNFDDTALIANTTNSGSYTWTVPVIATAPTARVRVTASDLAGNQSLGLSSTFAIDSLAPDVILTANFGAMAGVFTPNPTINDNIDTAGELTYAWSVVSAPAGGNVYFSVPFIANPSISGDEHGVYTLALTVTDRAGNTVTEEAIFNWQGGSIYPEVIYPSAGNYLSAGTANIVWTLAGADNILSYQVESSENSGVSWTTIATGLSNDATTTPWNISAGTNSMNNMIRVTAYDNVDTPYIANSGLFSIDSSAPVVNLTSSLGTINTATLVTASATDNFTSAGQLTYNWSVLSAPSGGNLLISSSTILTPTLAGSVNGNYSALLSVSDQAGNTATSSVAFTWYITPTGGGGGGGGGNTIIYCTQVDYSAWGTCNGGFQTRTVLSRSPLSCSLTTAQQIAVTQTCVAPELPPTEPPVVEEPIVPGTGSTYPFDPEAVDVIELARQNFTKVDTNLVKSVIGRIVLQVEDRGRAWYINPKDNHKYYLGRPTNAFQVMRILGDGILTSNLDKIPVGIIDGSLTMDVDSDKDGLPDRLEEGLRTDPFKKDTDGDGFSDYEEVKNGYDPLSGGKPKTDLAFTKKNNGRIFIQVQQNGEAWYVDPISQRRYYLGRPVEALAIMRMLSLGISNEDINKIPVGSFSGIVK